MQKELGELMLGLELPAMTTISRVEVTEDLKHAKVWISIFSNTPEAQKEVLATLTENLYEMQGVLNRKLTMHHTPRIAFAIDTSAQYASRINELLKKTHDDEDEQQ